jgi:RecA-family ATPase
MHRRTAAIAKSMALPLDLLTNFDIRCLVGEDAVLATAINDVVVPTDLWREMCRYIAKTRPVLVVIDTLAAVFAGNENSRTQAQQFVNLIAGPCIKYGATVLMLAHPSRAGMATGTGDSGTTHWSNAVRSRLYLERVKIDGTEPDLDARVLRSKKTNYAKTGAEIRLRWHAGTLIVDEDTDGKSAVKAASGIKAENVFLDLLAHYEREGRNVSPNPSNSYAPSVFAKDDRRDGLSKTVLEGAMNRLFSAGTIRAEDFGRPSRPAKRIVMA